MSYSCCCYCCRRSLATIRITSALDIPRPPSWPGSALILLVVISAFVFFFLKVDRTPPFSCVPAQANHCPFPHLPSRAAVSNGVILCMQSWFRARPSRSSASVSTPWRTCNYYCSPPRSSADVRIHVDACAQSFPATLLPVSPNPKLRRRACMELGCTKCVDANMPVFQGRRGGRCGGWLFRKIPDCGDNRKRFSLIGRIRPTQAHLRHSAATAELSLAPDS